MADSNVGQNYELYLQSDLDVQNAHPAWGPEAVDDYQARFRNLLLLTGAFDESNDQVIKNKEDIAALDILVTQNEQDIGDLDLRVTNNEPTLWSGIWVGVKVVIQHGSDAGSMQNYEQILLDVGINADPSRRVKCYGGSHCKVTPANPGVCDTVGIGNRHIPYGLSCFDAAESDYLFDHWVVAYLNAGCSDVVPGSVLTIDRGNRLNVMVI